MPSGYNTYIGMRYVPILGGTWNAETAYEPLVIVTDNTGNSYTSKTFVPAGTPLTNTTYWQQTGNYNAQVEMYRQEVQTLSNTVDDIKKQIPITPQMFGAKGDGTTDDTAAIQSMITYMSDNATNIVINSVNFKDFRKYTIVWNGLFKISADITFPICYGLVLDGIKLIAAETFTGTAMLSFPKSPHSCVLTNFILDGNGVANTCLSLTAWYLNFKANNGAIRHFTNYGLYLVGNNNTLAFEFIANNLQITQYDSTPKAGTGIGLYVGPKNSDNVFNNMEISYCAGNQFIINSASNIISNSHFYASEEINQNTATGNNVNFSNCYFDGQKLTIAGRATVEQCYFSSQNWNDGYINVTGTLGQNIIIGNQFHSPTPGGKSVTGYATNDVIYLNFYERCEVINQAPTPTPGA